MRRLHRLFRSRLRGNGASRLGEGGRISQDGLVTRANRSVHALLQ